MRIFVKLFQFITVARNGDEGSSIKFPSINEPFQLRARLPGLREDCLYKIFVAAFTERGSGDSKSILVRTARIQIAR